MIRMALSTVNRFKYSETFIRDHYEGLPFQEKYFLYGGYLPVKADEQFLPRLPLPGMLPGFLLTTVFRKQTQKALARFLTTKNINTVLAEYGPCGVEILDVCRKLDIPLFTYFHGFDISRKDVLNSYGSGYRDLFSYCPKIFCVSREMKATLLGMGAPAEKVVMNPCGANLYLFQEKKEHSSPPVFLTASRFVSTKAPDKTIRAFARTLNEFPGAKLRMAGEGKLLAMCKKLVSQLGIEHAVKFLGMLSREHIAKEMQEAAIFLQHSVTASNGQKEGSPVAIAEAGASGLPVISTRHAGIPELVVHNRTGFLVEEGDVSGMSRYMTLLLRDSSRASEMGRAAAKHIRQNFSLQKTLDTLAKEISRGVRERSCM